MICSWEEFAFLAIPILLAYPKTLQLQNLRVGFPVAFQPKIELPRTTDLLAQNQGRGLGAFFQERETEQSTEHLVTRRVSEDGVGISFCLANTSGFQSKKTNYRNNASWLGSSATLKRS